MKRRFFTIFTGLLLTALLLGTVGCADSVLQTSLTGPFENAFTLEQPGENETILIQSPQDDEPAPVYAAPEPEETPEPEEMPEPEPVQEEAPHQEMPVYTAPQHVVCPQCGGSGQFYNPILYFDGMFWQGGYTACPTCGGSGWLY